MQFGCTITALTSVFSGFMHVNATKECGFTGHTYKNSFELTHNMAVVLFLMIILVDLKMVPYLFVHDVNLLCDIL